jgi:hypothetical protein
MSYFGFDPHYQVVNLSPKRRLPHFALALGFDENTAEVGLASECSI